MADPPLPPPLMDKGLALQSMEGTIFYSPTQLKIFIRYARSLVNIIISREYWIIGIPPFQGKSVKNP